MNDSAELVCIVCPAGCRLNVQTENGKFVSVSGNKCRRGEVYASQEAVDPRRSISTTVKTTLADPCVLPVKTSSPVPKNMIMAVMRECASIRLAPPVRAGQVVIKNICSSGCDIVATAAMD